MSSDISTFLFAQVVILAITSATIALILIKFDYFVLAPFSGLFTIVYWSHIRASCMDPGIIPRNPTDVIPHPPQQDPEEKIIFKYCPTCKIYRNSRAKHCRFCDNCVMQFDHHCPWLGNCVGVRNYRYFLTFVVSTVIACLYVIALCIADITIEVTDREYDGSLASLKYVGGSIALLLLTSIVELSLIPLACFHLKLLAIGETTNENLRGVYESRENPANRGLSGNIHEACCIPIAKSQLELHCFVDETFETSKAVTLEEIHVIKYGKMKFKEHKNSNDRDDEVEKNTQQNNKCFHQ